MDAKLYALREQITPTNKQGIVLNPYFSEWTDIIKEDLTTRADSGFQLVRKILSRHQDVSHYGDRDLYDFFYNFEPYNRLLDECLQHREDYGKKPEQDTWLVLGHSFQPLIKDRYLFDDRYKERVLRQYEEDLWDIPEKNMKEKNLGVVMIESPHSYTTTSRLLEGEESPVDWVLFSGFDDGYLLTKKDLGDYHDKALFMAGAYNKRCFTHTIEEAIRSHNFKDLSIVRNLVINSPWDNRIVRCKGVTGGYKRTEGMSIPILIVENNIVSLDEFKKKFFRFS